MEFLYLLCNLYIIGLTVALPLYTGGTYWQIGDSKYMLFRNLSLLCLNLWLAVSLAEGIRRKCRHGYLQAGAGSAGAGSAQRMYLCFSMGLWCCSLPFSANMEVQP